MSFTYFSGCLQKLSAQTSASVSPEWHPSADLLAIASRLTYHPSLSNEFLHVTPFYFIDAIAAFIPTSCDFPIRLDLYVDAEDLSRCKLYVAQQFPKITPAKPVASSLSSLPPPREAALQLVADKHFKPKYVPGDTQRDYAINAILEQKAYWYTYNFLLITEMMPIFETFIGNNGAKVKPKVRAYMARLRNTKDALGVYDTQLKKYVCVLNNRRTDHAMARG